jgi:hypothetical protein
VTTSTLKRAAALWLVAACVWAAPLRADGPPQRPDGMPVIAAGRENDILALIRPWTMGQEITPGWVLDGIQIESTRIRYVLRSRDGGQRALAVEFPGRVPQAKETTKNFALLREPAGVAPPSPDPLDVLAAAVAKNDVGTFWPAEAPNDSFGGSGDRGDLSSPGGRSTRDWRDTLRAASGDGVLIFLAALVFVLAHLRRQLRRDPPWVAPVLLGIVVAGAALRAVLPHENLMEAWAYERLAPLAARIYEGPVLRWLNAVAGGNLFLSDVLFKSNYLLSIVTPLVVYAHARFILKDHRRALAAAGLIAFLPEHLRFSRSDVYMIQSLATSSLTFVVLYTALIDRSRGWRIASFVILPFLCTATYFVRPENIVFVLLDLGAIYICARAAGGLTAGSFVAAAIVSSTALADFVFKLLAHYSDNLQHGLSLHTLWNAARIFFNFRLNTLVNPWITPPGLTLLALLGAVTLWREGERPRCVFLLTWLGGFFLVHSFVYPYEAAMQARYHMNLMTPFVLLAAAATPLVLSWRPAARWAVAAYLVASPLLHRDFIADTDFNEMREFTFLSSLRQRIPAGCTVLEYSGLPGEGTNGRQFASRLERVAGRLAGGTPSGYWQIVPAAVVEGDGVATQSSEKLSPEAEALLAEPPPCLVFYEGLTCSSLRRAGQERTPICQTIRDRLDLVPIATASFESRIYDSVNAGYLAMDDSGGHSIDTLPEGTPVKLTAFRARGIANGSGRQDTTG